MDILSSSRLWTSRRRRIFRSSPTAWARETATAVKAQNAIATKATVSTTRAPLPKSRRLTAAQPTVSTATPRTSRSQRARRDSLASTLFLVSRAAAGLKSLGLVILTSRGSGRRRRRAGNSLKPSDAAQKRLVTEIVVAHRPPPAFLE